MSWSIGYDRTWQRDIGYGVPAVCDHPDCSTPIDRGLAYVCGADPYGGEHGCGLYFCSRHLVGAHQQCERCVRGRTPFPAKPDVAEWMQHKLTHESWARWREEHPDAVALPAAALPPRSPDHDP